MENFERKRTLISCIYLIEFAKKTKNLSRSFYIDKLLGECYYRCHAIARPHTNVERSAILEQTKEFRRET